MADAPGNPLFVNMDEKSQYKGTLVIEAWDSLIDSITGEAQSEVDLAFNAIGAAASTASAIADPFATALGAGFGWIMEHVGILKEALDEVMGDPEDIQANVDATKGKAADLRVLAEDHRSSLARPDDWTGASSERFEVSMDAMGKELDGLANAVEGKAKIVAMMGTLVSVLRDLVRDAIAQLLGSLTANGVIGIAGAIFTFGGSLVYAGAQIAQKVGALSISIATKVERVISALSTLMSKITGIDDIVERIGKGWGRFHGDSAVDAGEIGWELYKTSGEVDKSIDKAVLDAAAKRDLDAAYEKSNEAGAKYQDTKKAESEQADDVSKANAALSTASDQTKVAGGELSRVATESNRAAEDVNRAVTEVNRAAKSGDQAAFAAANKKYDAAKAKLDATKKEYDTTKKEYDAAKAKTAEAAAKVARESRELSDSAKASYDALQAGKPADDAAKKAYDEYLKYTGATADPDITAKNDAAKVANESYEKANVDFMDKNAAAAEATAKAFASGTDADIKAAEQASKEAQTAGKSLESAAAEAKTAGDVARAAHEKATGGQGGGGAPASEKPADPLEHARKVNASTGLGDALKGAFFSGDLGGPSDDKSGTPGSPVKH